MLTKDLLRNERKIISELKEIVGRDKTVKVFSSNVQNNHKNGLPLYNKDWTWSDKIVYVIKEADKPMKPLEIYDKLLSLEPNPVNYWMNPLKILSTHLSNAFKQGRIEKFKVKGHRYTYYVHPSWLDENGMLVPEYSEKIRLL